MHHNHLFVSDIDRTELHIFGKNCPSLCNISHFSQTKQVYFTKEKYLRYALLIMPDDPIVNDHYGDVLWKLNFKLQASYYWKTALLSEEVEEKMKKDINNKLIFGLKN